MAVRLPAPATPALRTQDVARLALKEVIGPVMTPGSREYAAECATFNLNRPLRPAVVVGATCEEDVRVAVHFAARQGMPIAVKSTAHQVVRPAEGAMLITTGRMKHLSVDVRTRTVRAGAGVCWSEVLSRTAELDLAPVMGSDPQAGVVGYTLGGGQSPLLGRTHGYAADHVRRMRVVTADGHVRTAAPHTESDLFWALLGGKGNFGVVTEVEFEVFPVPRFYGGGLFFRGENFDKVLQTWRRWVETVPQEMTSSLALRHLPDVPTLPEPLRGAFVVHVRIGHLGGAADGERLVAPLRAAAPVLFDTVEDRPVTAVGEIHGDRVEPMAYVDRSVCLREFPEEAADALVKLAGPGSGRRPASLEIRALGGALDREPEVPNAVATRGVPFVVYGYAVGGDDRADELGRELTGVMDGLAPWAADRHMVNFMSPDDVTDAEGLRAAYGPGRYARLVEVKHRYDPDNLFRFDHNIRPV